MQRRAQEERIPPSTDNASVKNVYFVGTLQGLGGEKGAVILKQGEMAGITQGAPADDQFKIKRRVRFFPISVNICSKVNRGSCENHLCGQQGQDLVCSSSDSHYTWKACLICFNSNRQKVKHLTKVTTSG